MYIQFAQLLTGRQAHAYGQHSLKRATQERPLRHTIQPQRTCAACSGPSLARPLSSLPWPLCGCGRTRPASKRAQRVPQPHRADKGAPRCTVTVDMQCKRGVPHRVQGWEQGRAGVLDLMPDCVPLGQ